MFSVFIGHHLAPVTRTDSSRKLGSRQDRFDPGSNSPNPAFPRTGRRNRSHGTRSTQRFFLPRRCVDPSYGFTRKTRRKVLMRLGRRRPDGKH